MLSTFRRLDVWTKMVTIVLFSQLLLGKAAGYLGVALLIPLVFDSRVLLNRWYNALIQRSHILHSFAWALLASVLYAFGEVLYGLLQGFSASTAVQLLIFNVNPFFCFIGIWVGAMHPNFLRKYIRILAWLTCIYAIIYFLFLSHTFISLSGILPGTDLRILGTPETGSPLLLGLVAYEPTLAKFSIPILTLVFLVLVNQKRADWLGLGLGLLIWGVLAKRLRRVFIVFSTLALVLFVAFVTDVHLPAMPGRGGDVSARETVARLAGSISPEAAELAGGYAGNARFYYGTVVWRTHWWAAIRNEVSKDPKSMIFGLGYGYPLGELAGRAVEKQGTRSPHNIFYFVLAYSGLVGVTLFFGLQLCLLRLLWQAYRRTGDTYGLAYFAYIVSGAFFGNFLETPLAIPFFLIIGMSVAPLFVESETYERSLEFSEFMGPSATGERIIEPSETELGVMTHY
jgi:O-Antigen ligase